jgi:hypothetical protein
MLSELHQPVNFTFIQTRNNSCDIINSILMLCRKLLNYLLDFAMPSSKGGSVTSRIFWMVLGLVWMCSSSCGHSGGADSGLCSNPAPLLGTSDSAAPGYLILHNSGIDAQAETTRLSNVYGFQPKYIYTFGGFSAEFSDNILSHLRCEPSIKSIEYDSTNSAS